MTEKAGDSGPEPEEESSTFNSAPCPFCGVDAFDPEGDGDVCSHLVASWALDPWDDAGGVASDGPEYADALWPGKDLGLACWELLDFIVTGSDDARIEECLARVRTAVANADSPPWWREVESYTIDSYANVDNLPGTEPVVLGEMASPIVSSLAESLPGVRVTGADLGGMTSGGWLFVWSLDRVAAAKGLCNAILAAAATVRSIIATAANSAA